MLLVTSANGVPCRATINAEALKAHKRDSAHTLVKDITTELPPEVPVTEKSMEAIILKGKGPYKRKDINKLMALLNDKANNPIQPGTKGTDNAQLLGFVAIDLAKYHPFEPKLKEAIISRIQEMEAYSFFIQGQPLNGTYRSHYYFDNFIAALFLINQSKASEYIQKYNLDMKSIELNIELEIPNN